MAVSRSQQARSGDHPHLLQAGAGRFARSARSPVPEDGPRLARHDGNGVCLLGPGKGIVESGLVYHIKSELSAKAA